MISKYICRVALACLGLNIWSLSALANEVGSEEIELEAIQKDLTPKSQANPKVLDFEADVIEGERKLPSLFLQMEIETPNLDAVIYRRKNFNEFHVLEVDRKPLYKKPE